jgi:uncharacterized protein involved in outer membrane biogenesis
MRKKIAKYIKIGSLIIIVTSAILITGAALLFYFYPEESVLNIIKSKSESALGRKVEIGSLRYSIRGVILQDVTISDIDESGTKLSDDKSLLKAEEAVIQFSLFSLLRKDYTINALYFKICLYGGVLIITVKVISKKYLNNLNRNQLLKIRVKPALKLKK